jgi:hypothetical protein
MSIKQIRRFTMTENIALNGFISSVELSNTGKNWRFNIVDASKGDHRFVALEPVETTADGETIPTAVQKGTIIIGGVFEPAMDPEKQFTEPMINVMDRKGDTPLTFHYGYIVAASEVRMGSAPVSVLSKMLKQQPIE